MLLVLKERQIAIFDLESTEWDDLLDKVVCKHGQNVGSVELL